MDLEMLKPHCKGGGVGYYNRIRKNVSNGEININKKRLNESGVFNSSFILNEDAL